MNRQRAVDPLPFLRRGQSERLKKSRRKKTRRRLVLLGLGLFGIGLIGGAAFAGRHYLRHSARFNLHHIEFGPTAHAPREEMREIVGRYLGTNLFRLDVGRVAEEIGTIRWVRTAAVKRILPDRLHCAIEERQPSGMARIGNRIWLVDEEGSIDVYGEKTTMYSFPIFTGVEEEDGERQREQIRRGVDLLDFLESVEPGLTARISEVDLARADRIALHMTDGGPEVRLHPSEFATNLERYLTMREYLATHFGDGAYVDLRFRDSITYLPAISRRR